MKKGMALVWLVWLGLETNVTEVEEPGRKGNQAKKTCYRHRKGSSGFGGFKKERGIYFS